jgi:hypothetical protein
MTYTVIDETHVWTDADVARMRELCDELGERNDVRVLLTTADEGES